MPEMTIPALTPAFLARLPLNEQLMDALSDALVSVSDALDIATGPSGNSKVTVIRPRIQAIYDDLNSLMKEFAD